MSRNDFRGPKLPKVLLDQFGGSTNKHSRDVSRKDRRRAERHQKKATRSRIPARGERLGHARRQAVELEENEDDDDDEDVDLVSSKPFKAPILKEKPVKSILKKATAKPVEHQASPSPIFSLDEDNGGESEGSTGSFTVSRQAAKAGLVDEDDAIASLERKLGKKGSKKSKQSTDVEDDDDLDWLLGGGGSGSEDESKGVKRKRAAPQDEKWLRDKRRKAGGLTDEVLNDGHEVSDVLSEDGSDEEDMDDIDNPFSEDELSDDDFEGFSEEDEEKFTPQPKKSARENPYIAPVQTDAGDIQTATMQATAKYIPPSLRAKLASSDSDATLQQIQRRLQGQLNRLSEANMLSIIQSIEQIYTNNARQHVTSSLIDLLITRVSDPARLEDAYLILHAAFSAALYRVIGVAFGAQILEKIVETFDSAYDTAPTAYEAALEGARSTTSKQEALNTIAFLAVLYDLHVVGPSIVFDYIRQLLSEDLSETGAEILLRILHFSGPQLRADDPSSLKDIVLLLQRKVADAGGEERVPKRTKFLIHEINDLKNNRLKAAGAPGGSRVVVSEHLATMRKTLGSLGSARGGGGMKSIEPLRPTLADIRNSEKKGKWWLPGASWHDPAKIAADGNGEVTTIPSRTSKAADDDVGYESETPGHVNLSKLARAQGMNTDIRRKIFISIMSAADFRDAHMRLLKLHLKARQQLEIPRVLIHCAGAEGTYNPYYALIARKFCDDGKLKKAFQFGLWDVVRRLEDAEEDDDGGEDGMDGKKIGNLAKFFGALMASAGLRVEALRKVEFGLYMPVKVAVFAEALLSSVLLEVAKSAKTVGLKAEAVEEARHARVKSIFFSAARSARGIVQPLKDFTLRVIAKGDMAGERKRDRRIIEKGCRAAVEGLEEAEREGVVNATGDVSEDDESSG